MIHIFLTWKKYAKKLDMPFPFFTLPQGKVCIMRKLEIQIPSAIQELNKICVGNKNTTTLTMTHSNVLVISRSELVKKHFLEGKNKRYTLKIHCRANRVRTPAGR